MKANQPFIHLFRSPGGFYIYDVNKNVIIKAQQDIWSFLNNWQKESCVPDSQHTLIHKMKADGFLSDNKVTEIIHPADGVLNYYLTRKVRMVTLQVTQQCNLRCDYCAYSGGYNNRIHSNKKMDFDTAKKSIDFYLEHSIDTEVFAVGFYGGEPLIEFELIKKCVSYIERVSEGKKLLLTMTSNGTLLKEEIVQFLEEHNFSLLISLDGPKEIQDKNRKFAFSSCGTFDKVIENVEMIKDKFPNFYKKITFNAVLDEKEDFSCINEFFADFETIKEIDLSVSQISDNYAKSEIARTEDFECKIGYEHFKLILSKICPFDDKYISKIVKKDYILLQRLYNQLVPSEKLPEKHHPSGPCVPGVQRLFINADGNIFPCERVSEYSSTMLIGNINTGFNLEKVRELLNFGKISENNCKNCWAFRFCTICAANADTGSGLSSDRKIGRCESIRYSIENKLKDICTLKENNFDFGAQDWLIIT